MKLHTMPAALPLLLYHGLMSSPQEFGLMAHALRSRGIVHQAPTVAGYTLAGGNRHLDWHDWRTAAVADLPRLTCAAPGAQPSPVILGGLCMGGMLAASMAAAVPNQVAGLVLMSPTFAYVGWAQSPVRHLRHLGYWTGLDRYFSVKERHPFGVKNDKIRKWIVDALAQQSASAAGPARIPLRALREADRMMHTVRADLAQLRCPLLVIHAREDEITRLDSVRRVFDALPVADKELVVLENSYHMISIDNDRQRVAATIADFVNRVRVQRQAEIDAVAPLLAAHQRPHAQLRAA
jgi:carboxylesterase